MSVQKIVECFEGAKLEVVLNPIITTPNLPMRFKIKQQVAGCRECWLVDGCKQPVPYHGTGSPLFVVIGEAPGKTEDQYCEPFIGASGNQLRGIMGKVGIDVQRVWWMNTVSCFPNVAGRVRQPSDGEMAACRGNMLGQLEAANCPYVLLVGATALKAFRWDLKITSHHGRVFVWMNKYVVMPILHPAAALRGNREYLKVIAEDLELWRGIVEGEIGALECLGLDCVICGGYVDHYDPDGVGWCDKHWEGKGGGEWMWQISREKWKEVGKRVENTKRNREDEQRGMF